MANLTSITHVTDPAKARSHLEGQDVDTSELTSDLDLKWEGRQNGFSYPNFRPDLDRMFAVESGTAPMFRTLTDVPSVDSKEKAIAHLEGLGVDTERFQDMEGDQAAEHIDWVAGEEGYFYPNYRPS